MEILFILHVYIAADRDNEHKNSDHDAAIFLRQWVAEAILPTEEFAEPSPYSMSQPCSTIRLPQANILCITEEKATFSADEVARFHAMSLSGILLLARLKVVELSSENEHLVTILTCLASFTDLNDPWTCSEASHHAYILLRDFEASENLSNTLTSLLQEQIKPLFAKTRNPAITQQGRRAVDPISGSATIHSDLDGETKPWKYHDAYSVTVFQWVLKHLDVRIIITPKWTIWLIQQPGIVSAGELASSHSSPTSTDR